MPTAVTTPSSVFGLLSSVFYLLTSASPRYGAFLMEDAPRAVACVEAIARALAARNAEVAAAAAAAGGEEVAMPPRRVACIVKIRCFDDEVVALTCRRVRVVVSRPEDESPCYAIGRLRRCARRARSRSRGSWRPRAR